MNAICSVRFSYIKAMTHKQEQLTEGPVACPGSSLDCFLFLFPFPLDAIVFEFLLGGLAVSSFKLSFASYLFFAIFKGCDNTADLARKVTNKLPQSEH